MCDFLSESDHRSSYTTGVVAEAHEGCYLALCFDNKDNVDPMEYLPTWCLSIGDLDEDEEEEDTPDMALDPDDGTLSVLNGSHEKSKSYFITVENCKHVVSAEGEDLLMSTKLNEARPYITFIVLLPPRKSIDLATLVPFAKGETRNIQNNSVPTATAKSSGGDMTATHTGYDDASPTSGNGEGKGENSGSLEQGQEKRKKKKKKKKNKRCATTQPDYSSIQISSDVQDVDAAYSKTAIAPAVLGSVTNSGNAGAVDKPFALDIFPLLPAPASSLPSTSLSSSSWLCTQSTGGHLTHFAHTSTYHAVDFRCAVGTPILAIFDAEVIEVTIKSQSTEGSAGMTALAGPHVNNLFAWNSILLKKRNNSGSSPEEEEEELYVEYVHIHHEGINVQVGQQVLKGDILCLSGNAGFCPEPHLHMQIQRSNHPSAPSVPILYGGKPFIAGTCYNDSCNYDHQVSNNSNSTNSSRRSSSSSYIAKALQLIQEYYACMNAHNVSAAIAFLHEDVFVTFPEKERNWGGVQTAGIKFGGMFEKMPTFTGTYEVQNVITRKLTRSSSSSSSTSLKDGSDDLTVSVITVACRFVCISSGSNSSRKMVYHIVHDEKNGTATDSIENPSSSKIIEIHHL